MEEYRNHLRGVIQEFVDETNSAWGQEILDNYVDYLRKFWLVIPKEANMKSLLDYIDVTSQ
jgi:glutamate synthase (NADPH/NADH) large chain